MRSTQFRVRSASRAAFSRSGVSAIAPRFRSRVCVTNWQPSQTYDVWHDRAALHFLTDPKDRAAYVERVAKAVLGGHVIIGTFALDGPERCSGLPVVRYDAASLAQMLGDGFALVETRNHQHTTPWQSVQQFQFSLFRCV